MIRIIIFVSILGNATTTTTILFDEVELIRIDKQITDSGVNEVFTYKNIDEQKNLLLQDDEITSQPFGKSGKWTAEGLDKNEKIESFELVDSKLIRQWNWSNLEGEETYFVLENYLEIYPFISPFLNHEGKWYMFESLQTTNRNHVVSRASLEKFTTAIESEVELFSRLKKKFLERE